MITELLGTNAIDYIIELDGDLRVSENADEILRVAESEVELNLARRLEPREEVDTYFGGVVG